MSSSFAQDLLSRKTHLLWWIGDGNHISDELLIEAVLNNGDFPDFLDLCRALGQTKVSKIFHQQTARRRHNYRPSIVSAIPTASS